jgi:DnaJ-domain-containing protein 1
MRWTPFASNPSEESSRQANRAERFLCDTMVCPLGPIADISATGIRVRCTESAPVAVGEIMPLALSSNGQSLRIKARVVRIKKKFFKVAEIAFQFVELSPSQAAAVVQLARFGFCQTAGSKLGSAAAEPQKAAAPKPTQGQQAATSKPSQNNASTRQQSTDAAPPPPAINVGVEIEDLYEVMGVAITATESEIRSAFRELAKRYHPDSSTEPDAAQQFARINKANGVLRDPKLRARYDEMLARSLAR